MSFFSTPTAALRCTPRARRLFRAYSRRHGFRARPARVPSLPARHAPPTAGGGGGEVEIWGRAVATALQSSSALKSASAKFARACGASPVASVCGPTQQTHVHLAEQPRSEVCTWRSCRERQSCTCERMPHQSSACAPQVDKMNTKLPNFGGSNASGNDSKYFQTTKKGALKPRLACPRRGSAPAADPPAPRQARLVSSRRSCPTRRWRRRRRRSRRSSLR